MNVELLKADFTDEYFPPHIHDYYVIGLTTSGAGDMRCDARPYVTPRDSVLLMEPGTVHSNRPVPGSAWRMRTISLSTDLFRSLVGADAVDENEVATFINHVIEDAVLWSDFDCIFKQMENGRPAFDAMSVVLRQLAAKGVLCAMKPDQPSRIQKAKSHIDRNMTCALSLDAIAREANLSPYHMSRVFKSTYGISPMRYLKEARLSNAKNELHSGRRISDIAAKYGFSDESHFCRSFAAKFGITPGAYSREIRRSPAEIATQTL